MIDLCAACCHVVRRQKPGGRGGLDSETRKVSDLLRSSTIANVLHQHQLPLAKRLFGDWLVSPLTPASAYDVIANSDTPRSRAGVRMMLACHALANLANYAV